MKQTTPQQVQAAYEAGETLNILDVREVAEVAAGAIPGMTHIPLGLLEFRMHELDKNKPYIVVCHAGGRSAQATMFLQQHGYDVTNMVGGMSEWQGEVE